MEVQVIEWARVAELREEVGEADFAEVVELFLDEVEGVLQRLEVKPEQATLESDLHFVRGSAVTLGFQDLGEICGAGERMAREARFEHIDIPKLLHTYQASKAEFISRLA